MRKKINKNKLQKQKQKQNNILDINCIKNLWYELLKDVCACLIKGINDDNIIIDLHLWS